MGVGEWEWRLVDPAFPGYREDAVGAVADFAEAEEGAQDLAPLGDRAHDAVDLEHVVPRVVQVLVVIDVDRLLAAAALHADPSAGGACRAQDAALAPGDPQRMHATRDFFDLTHGSLLFVILCFASRHGKTPVPIWDALNHMIYKTSNSLVKIDMLSIV